MRGLSKDNILTYAQQVILNWDEKNISVVIIMLNSMFLTAPAANNAAISCNKNKPK